MHFWGRFWVIFGPPFCIVFGTVFGTVFGAILGRFWELFGPIFGRCIRSVWVFMGSFGLSFTFVLRFRSPLREGTVFGNFRGPFSFIFGSDIRSFAGPGVCMCRGLSVCMYRGLVCGCW